MYKGKTKAHPNLAIATSSPEFSKSHMVPVKVNGTVINFLLDTGSAATLLRLDMWQQCRNTSHQLEKWVGTSLVGADGTPLPVNGTCKLNFCFANSSFPHPVLVVESLLCEGIIGMDFLQQNTCSINLTSEGVMLSVGPGCNTREATSIVGNGSAISR